jgi:hypothetical protein
MHKACFESYCLSLLERDNLDNNYEGVFQASSNIFLFHLVNVKWCPCCASENDFIGFSNLNVEFQYSWKWTISNF